MSLYLSLIMPFTEESKKYVSDMNLSVIEPKAEDLDFVFSEINKMMSKDYVFEKLDDSLLKQYFVFYPYARIMLSFADKNNWYRKFSDFYYKLVVKNVIGEEIRFLEKLEIKFDVDGEDFLIPYKDYVFAKVNNEKDKLVNKPLKNGNVYLSKQELDDFVGRYVANKVTDGLPVNTKNLPVIYKKYGNRLRKLVEVKKKKFNTKNMKIDYNVFPPCMEKIFNELMGGGKPSHIERYYLATFLFTLKMDFGNVLDIFSKASDYKEDIAKYQLEKIKGYSSPSCNTIKSMGFCYADEFCEKIKSPVDYYWKKKRGFKNAKQKES